MRIQRSFAVGPSVLLLCLHASAPAVESGLAAGFPRDVGLATHPDVLLFEDFEGASSPFLNDGRNLIEHVSPGAGSHVMVSQNRAGKHVPWDTHTKIPASEVVHYRFYTQFDQGYQMGGGVKGPGISAQRTGHPGGRAGVKPKGDDSFSARICFDSKAQPYIYYYHMDMGQWGSNAKQDIGTPVSMEPERWYCLEMMLKPNAPDAKDGELKLWVDGELKVHKTEIRWRTIPELQINWANHSAYFGGDWTSPQDQRRFEDNLVIARSYIGPISAGR